MELKKYIRRGTIAEARGYEEILRLDGSRPTSVVLLLEGRARRKILLNARRRLYENYYAISFLGLEDYLTGSSRKGAVGTYPGAHYVVWDGEDFMTAVGMYPELARRAIFELSRRIRTYDAKSRVTDAELKQEVVLDIGPPQQELTDALYEMSFADEDTFPPHLLEKLSKKFEPGEALMTQGELSSELYIILGGEVSIQQEDRGMVRDLGILRHGDLVGEMAQFDGLPRSATVKALSPTQVLVFRPENFHMLFQLHPRWSQKLLVTLAERVENRRRDLETISLAVLKRTSS